MPALEDHSPQRQPGEPSAYAGSALLPSYTGGLVTGWKSAGTGISLLPTGHGRRTKDGRQGWEDPVPPVSREDETRRVNSQKTRRCR
jgi:hypothetical protein